MFDLPERYVVNQSLDLKNFIKEIDKRPDKTRFKENVQSVQLMWQIIGEDVPSFVNEDYRCNVIMGLDVKLKKVKSATFFSELLQHLIKEPCVMRFYDDKEEVYSFAHKRLSHTDETQVVILQRIETPPTSVVFADKTTDKLRQHLSFDALLNKRNKLSLYLEAIVKAFIIVHPKLYSGIEDQLDRKLWYNEDDVLVLFERLLNLQRLNVELKAEKLPGEKAKLNSEIKKRI